MKLPADQERIFRAMYRLNAAYADQVLARLLAALKQQRPVGQDPARGHRRPWRGVRRERPDRPRRQPRARAGRGAAGDQAAGGVPAPARHAGRPARQRAGGADADRGRRRQAPSRARRPASSSRFDKGALSELYLGNGVNRFSLVRGGPPAPLGEPLRAPEPDYYRARYAGIGGQPEPPLTQPVQAIFGRLEKAFAGVLPLTGRRGDPPKLTLLRWTPNGVQPVDDPREVNRMARQLKNAWMAANGAEVPPGRSTGQQPKLSPKEEEELKALGYVAGD